MALRIGGAKKPLPVEEPEAQAPPAEEPMPEPEAPPEAAGGQDPMALSGGEDPMAASGGGGLDPVTAGYRGPEMGPFQCANCQYFSQGEKNTCEFVSGFIDEGGMCNLFTPMGGGEQQPPTEEPPMEQAPPAEGAPLPEEEPPVK